MGEWPELGHKEVRLVELVLEKEQNINRKQADEQSPSCTWQMIETLAWLHFNVCIAHERGLGRRVFDFLCQGIGSVICRKPGIVNDKCSWCWCTSWSQYLWVRNLVAVSSSVQSKGKLLMNVHLEGFWIDAVHPEPWCGGSRKNLFSYKVELGVSGAVK